MTSQPGLQTIAIHILPKSKCNQTMKLGQLMDYNREKFLFKNFAENEARWLVPDLFLFFEKYFVLSYTIPSFWYI